MCHGDYDTKEQKYYLAFENGYGELDKIFP